jgi:hypothetical protein
MSEEGDSPGTAGGVEETTAKLARTAFSIDGVAHRLADLIEAFRGYMEKRSASMHRVAISIGGSMFLVIVALLLVIGACGVVIGMDIADRSAQQREWARDTAQLTEKMDDLRRQYRMTELKLDDWSVVGHRAGLALPGDYTRGPQGNLDSESFTKPKEK